MEKQEVLRKVQALLDKAESSGFTAEADAARAKADQMMMAYSISMWEVDQRCKPEERAKPEIRRYDLVMDNSPVVEQMQTLFAVLCGHLRVKAVYFGFGDKPVKSYPRQLFAKVVGFPQELDYLEIMFLSLRVQILGSLEPKPDPKFDFEDNLVLLKESGMKWERIHELLQPGVPWSRTHGVRYTKMYTDHCVREGKERMYTSPIVYQRNFVEGYAHKVSSRLYDIRMTRERHDQDGGTGVGLMLRDKSHLINELYDETFTNLKTLKPKRGKYDHSAYTRGIESARDADLGQDRVSRGPRELQ